jgi:hypothetical protein
MVDVQLSAVVQPSAGVFAFGVPATYAQVFVSINVEVQLSAVVQPSTGVFPFGVPATYAHVAVAPAAAHEPGVVPQSSEPLSVQSVVSLAVTVGAAAHEPSVEASKSASPEVSVQRLVSLVVPVSVTAHEPADTPKSVVPASVQSVVSVAVSVAAVYVPAT